MKLAQIEKEFNKAKSNDFGKDKDIGTLESMEQIIDVDETRQPCTLVLIGPVESGKSTISGQIMLKMGLIDNSTI